MKIRKLMSALLVALLAIGLTAMTTGEAKAQNRGGTLVYMVPADSTPSLDAHRETTFAVVHPISPFYSLLIRLDPSDKEAKRIVGDLATGWDESADHKTFTFQLRKGVKFHDGRPVQARDVKATFEKIIFPPEGVLSPRKAMFLMVDRIDTPDEYTVVFRLKFPSPAFVPALAMPYNNIYSADTLAQDIHWYEQNVNGSGPFKLVEYVPGSKVVGTRNDDYYLEGRPFLDGFEAVFTPKQNVYVQALRGGRAHSMFRGLPPAAVEDLRRAMGDSFRVQESTWNCVLLVAVNQSKKPFDDVRVRRALNLAIDRWGGSRYLSRVAIVKAVGGAVVPVHPLAPSDDQLKTLEGFWPDIKKSRAKARQLLKEAGVPEGFQFKLHNRSTDQPYKIVGTWLIDQWRQVGLNVEQWVQPTSAFYATLRAKPPQEFDLSMDFNCQSIVNPTLDISKFISWDKGPSNNSKYIDRKLDELYEAQMREPDFKKQREIIWNFNKRMTEEAAYLFTLWWQRSVVSNTKFIDWNITPSHYLNMQLDNVSLAGN
jgi:peptide/nickel transport system substrate-binding protein